jgi:hypothetical protein
MKSKCSWVQAEVIAWGQTQIGKARPPRIHVTPLHQSQAGFDLNRVVWEPVAIVYLEKGDPLALYCSG